MSAAENTDKLYFIEPEGTDEGMNIESLAGMLDDLITNGETLPQASLSELDQLGWCL